MLAVENKKKYTVADYMLLEEGAPFQLINNELIMSPSPSLRHQLILGEFYDALKNYLKEKGKTGLLILPPMDVHFDDDNVFQPDLIYISSERIDEIAKERIEGAPDLVVEILSPSNAYYDLRKKKEVYEKYGVKEYIIVDPMAKNIEVYVLNGGTYQLYQKAQLNDSLTSVVLPGFSIELSKLFK